jgi:hypothetical protein
LKKSNKRSKTPEREREKSDFKKKEYKPAVQELTPFKSDKNERRHERKR